MTKKPLIAQRWVAMGFAISGSALMYLLRYNLSVAIVAMVQPKNLHHQRLANLTDGEHLEQLHQPNRTSDHALADLHRRQARSLPVVSTLPPFNLTSAEPPLPPAARPVRRAGYDWDDNVQGIVLSSYFYGYIMLQILGGRLSEKYGAKWVLAAGVALPSVCTLLTPFASALGAWYMVVLRVAIGLLHATVLSTGFAIISVWMPEEEKSVAAIWLNIGLELGGMASLLGTGYVCSSPALGWRWAFYLAGLLPFVWLLPFVCLFYSRPDQHPRLSAYESRLIQQSRIRKQSMRDRCGTLREVPAKLRWRTVLSSRPVWANCAAKFCGYFGYYVITTKMPAYLDEVFNVPISQNGMLCALSFLGILCGKVLCVQLVHRLRQRQWMTLTQLRKCFQTLAMLIPAVCLLLISQFSSSLRIVTALIVLAMFGMGLQCGGETPQLTDFAQDLSGTVFGFCNMFVSLDGILAPFIAGEILERAVNVRQGWNLVFYLCALVYVLGALLFIWLADSTPQKWAMATFEPKHRPEQVHELAVDTLDESPEEHPKPNGAHLPPTGRF